MIALDVFGGVAAPPAPEGDIVEIQVLGPGCSNCRKLYAEVEKAVAQTGQPATITKVESMDDIVAAGILRTPGLVIDGKVVSSGRVPGATEIATMITAACGSTKGPSAESKAERPGGGGCCCG